MIVLGISALYHDSAAAIVCDGRIIAAAQEERFSRIKQDKSLPVNAIQYCLNCANIKWGGDLDAVVYYDDPLLTLNRFIANVSAAGDDSADLIARSAGSVFGQKLWIEKMLREVLGQLGQEDRLYTSLHHFSHAASAFYPSPFSSAAILTVDGVGEWNTTAIGRGSENNIELLRTIDYPHSLGLLYSAFTWFCGFRVNFGDYKLMGLAPYGRPVYKDLIYDNLIDVKPDGSFRLNLEYFDYQYGREMTNELFARLFDGPRRMPEAPLSLREMDMAASVQAVTSEIMLKLAKSAKTITGEKNLVMAGGVALNCTANGLLEREKIFDRIWIQPAAGDAGGALGAALAYIYQKGKISRTVQLPDAQQGSFLGPEYTNDEISAFLEKEKIHSHYFNDEALFPHIAGLLKEQKVIGLFHGRMEYGPRALGNRSIIADPRSSQMQSRMNMKIKYRESFRPFAPAVLQERCSDYFDDAQESPYMLFCKRVKNCTGDYSNLHEELEKDPDLIPVINRTRSDIPAVTHVDFSARVQTVDKERNPFFYQILKAFEALTGCGVLINTSFNVRGEPIVCTPEDAYKCFMNTEMEVLVMQNYVLYKNEQPAERIRHDRYDPD